MQRFVLGTLSTLLVLLLLAGCSTTDKNSWQEQYDLGVRYLSEDNYQEVIIAFTAAIEIDPKRADAFIGRGDAYVRFGEDNLISAINDYRKAAEIENRTYHFDSFWANSTHYWTTQKKSLQRC